ncbi:MAG: preprotein translocase subunit SecG [Bryobacteraceae bacterium]|jgi:preprotein translocase subunit SecG
MIVLLTLFHILICFFLVIVVLLQSGKAADLAGAFGGMGSQTAFGPRGSATLLSKATTVAAALFMITALTLAIVATKNAGNVGPGTTVLDKQPVTVPRSAPRSGGGQPVPIQIPVKPAPQSQNAPAQQPAPNQ